MSEEITIRLIDPEPVFNAPAMQVARIVCDQALTAPHMFGRIRAFCLKDKPGTLFLFPHPSESGGVISFISPRKIGQKNLKGLIADLVRFVSEYGERLDGEIPDEFTTEIPDELVKDTLQRANARLEANQGEALSYIYEIGEPKTEFSFESGVSDDVLVQCFADYVKAPGFFDVRDIDGYGEVVECDEAILIPKAVYDGALPVLARADFIPQCVMGVAIFAHKELPATVLVCYTGDPCATFAVFYGEPSLSRHRADKALDDSEAFVKSLGLRTGRLQPAPTASPFRLVTGAQEIANHLERALKDFVPFVLVSAHREKDRPIAPPFAALYNFAMAELAKPEGLVSHMDTIKLSGDELGAMIEVHFKDRSAIARATMIPKTSALVGQEIKLRATLKGAAAHAHLDRLLTLAEQDGCISRDEVLLGQPSADVFCAMLVATSVDRLEDYQFYLSSFQGLTEYLLNAHTGIYGIQPEVAIAQHRTIPSLWLMFGSADEECFRLHVIGTKAAIAASKQELAEIAKLELEPEAFGQAFEFLSDAQDIVDVADEWVKKVKSGEFETFELEPQFGDRTVN